MASIQPKTVNGKKYWQIVHSQRINGKPRPIVIEHLGTADSLLKRLNQKSNDEIRVKSYSHGLIAVLFTYYLYHTKQIEFPLAKLILLVGYFHKKPI